MFACALFLGACTTLGLEDETASGSRAALGAIDYTVSLDGLPPGDNLVAVVEGVLRTYTLKDRKVASVAALERRAENDLPELERILRADGFYDAKATAAVSEAGAMPEVRFEIDAGRRYAIGTAVAAFAREDPALPDPSILVTTGQLTPGRPARGDSIVSAEGRVVAWLVDRGWPYARFAERRAVAHAETGTIDVTSTFETGPRVSYGDIRIAGDSDVDESYVRGLVPFRAGRPVSRSALDDLQAKLSSTGLFESVSVRLPAEEEVQGDGPQPVTVTLAPARHRSVSGSLRYDTDRGPAVRLGWRHRNLSGRAEDFQTGLDLAFDEQRLTAELARPRYPSAKWTATEGFELRNTVDDAFDEKLIKVQAGLRRTIGSGWVVGGSLEGLATITDSDLESDTAWLGGLPLFARLDKSNDPLDATRGFRVSLGVAPYLGLVDGDPSSFAITSVAGSTYLPVIGEDRLVLAAKGRVASILSRNIEDVPLSQLFFAGGGASVRGFGFRSISPRTNGDETGGRFLTEAGLEARLKLFGDFGIVAFADGGLVEEEPFPNFKERMFVGVGGGLRYYSPVGPIRLDIAVPLGPRASDSSFEFYISLGQAF
ncbi:MAG: autotransporter assembly complex family protein [Pseudomonadota bacterium]|nr:autotransporter assembly complex family protein [Pseudomonadota bacterium]